MKKLLQIDYYSERNEYRIELKIEENPLYIGLGGDQERPCVDI
jgi:hypothetical protein